MSTFLGIHVRGQETETLARKIDEWLRPIGFGAATWMDRLPEYDVRIFGPAKTVVLARLTASWHVLYLDGYGLATREGVSPAELSRLGALVGDRIVYFAAQTTSDVYELAVLDGPELLRHLASSDHELHVSVGPHLPGEPEEGAFTYPEGEDGEWRSTPMEDARAVCAAMDLPLWEVEGTPPFARWERRGWLARLFSGR